MEKDERLVGIYLKIYHKAVLTMDDLRYLAEYDPECFLKTWNKIINRIPEAKTIMDMPAPTAQPPDSHDRPELSERQSIEKILENLKRLERNDFFTGGVDKDSVKNLLGNLYMELLFLHHEEDMPVSTPENIASFDKKA